MPEYKYVVCLYLTALVPGPEARVQRDLEDRRFALARGSPRRARRVPPTRWARWELHLQ